jgi:hypothetical protein
MNWILVICIGVNAFGCSSVPTIRYPSEDACYKALREMRTGDSPTSESDKKRNTVAYCYPEKGNTK